MSINVSTPFDEALVALLLGIPTVSSVCGTKVYHLEVWQATPSLIQFPCIVYRLTDDDPEEELAENSGLLTATYELTITAAKSADLRAVSEAIKAYFNDESILNDIQCGTEGLIPWISVFNDSESNEFAIEQQEKGLQTTSLQVAIDHWQTSTTHNP